jgi:hypothetical protein
VLTQSATDITQSYATWGHDKEDADSASGYNLDDESDWDMDPQIVSAYSSTIINDLKAIPTVSLVMDWDDLFGGTPLPGTPAGSGTVAPAPEGIYIHGSSSERATSFEYFNPNSPSDTVHLDAAVEMQGHSSTLRWNSDKLSFQLKFKSPYGPTELNYPIFAGSPDGANATSEFDTLILDATFNYSWLHQNSAQSTQARYVTDQVVSDLQNLAGGAAAHGKYVHLYINGLYWGVYNVHERTDDSFAAEYFGGSKDDYYAVKHASDDPTHKYTWVEGGIAAEQSYQALLTATRAVESSPTSTAAYQSVLDKLDVDDFIDYMIVHYYAGNDIDWSNNNWYATLNHVDPTARWHFHAWDQEHAFPTNETVGVNKNNVDNDQVDTPTELHRNLMANANYKLKFNDHVQKLLYNGGLLTPSVAAAVYAARANEIDRAIVGESARWGDNRFPTDPFTRDDFVTVTNSVINGFFPVRTGIVLGQFATAGWNVALAAPIFNNYGGEVALGFDVTITKPAGSPGAAEIYYVLDGSDPRLPDGTANPLAAHGAGPFTIDISAAKQIKARIKNGTDWSPVHAARPLSGENHRITLPPSQSCGRR